MFAFKHLLAASALASSAMAHFTLDYPTTRGFDEDIEGQFCGGFSSVSTTRQQFPLGRGPIWIDSHHTLATVVAFISTSADPTSFSDFNTTSNGTSIPLASNIFQVNEGEHCFNVDLGGLGVGLTNGSQVTLQVQFDGGDGDLYQCTDLILIDGFSVPSNETCANDASVTNATSTSTSTSTSSGASSATSAASTASPTTASSAGMAQHEVLGWGAVSAVMGVVGLVLL